MILKTAITSLLLTFSIASECLAATKIVTTNERKQQLDVVIEKGMARFNGGGNQYQLINLTTKKIYNVNLGQGVILDASIPPGGHKTEAKIPEIEFKKLGKGPEIAGFTTIQYQVYANRVLCETLFLSKQASSKIPAMKKFITVMGDIAKSGRGSMTKGASACRIAKTEIFDHFAKHGTLMKSVSSRGKVSFEVVKVEKDVLVDKDYFELPKSLKVTTMKELMEQMRQRMQK
ncbi:MAG: hypothetical protein HOM11_03375 [Methylococcales bacterium]|jgi:hypothetical protein|nr:hypothetical protein [Methylococcales bacterium]MBT7442888.1 hypothetical protein [Methylococcales bacterium]